MVCIGILLIIGGIVGLIWLIHDTGYEVRISLTDEIKYRKRGKKYD